LAVSIGQTHQLSKENLLSYPLGPFPLSIATLDGGLTKTVKATLFKALEENVEPLTTIPPDAALIVDAMAILQATKTSASMTYSELAYAVFNSITRGTPPEGHIDWNLSKTLSIIAGLQLPLGPLRPRYVQGHRRLTNS